MFVDDGDMLILKLYDVVVLLLLLNWKLFMVGIFYFWEWFYFMWGVIEGVEIWIGKDVLVVVIKVGLKLILFV